MLVKLCIFEYLTPLSVVVSSKKYALVPMSQQPYHHLAKKLHHVDAYKLQQVHT